MKEVLLEGLSKNVEEATIQTWFVEEGDPINEGDNLVELTCEEGAVTITSPVSGILAEVYYDEGEAVSKGEILCTVDDDESADEDDDADEDEDEEDDDEDEDDEELDEEDEDEDEDEEEDEE